ncbi:hypothetical protein HDU84_001718, partial [Entophlyctis sp. JEL0112]
MQQYDSFDALTKQRMSSYYQAESNLTATIRRLAAQEGWGESANAAAADLPPERRSSATGSGADTASFVTQMKTFVYYSGAAYCSAANIAAWNCSLCTPATGTSNVSPFESTDGNEQGYIAVNAGLKSIIVSFRGSSNLANWIDNIDILPTALGITGASTSVEVHSGFLDAWYTLQTSTLTKLKAYVAAYPGYGVVFAGHSLGAAITVLAAVTAISEGITTASQTSIIDIGEPRVGNAAFYQYVKGLGLAQASRVVNYGDIVPHLPLEAWGYNHHLLEHWVDSAGTLV